MTADIRTREKSGFFGYRCLIIMRKFYILAIFYNSITLAFNSIDFYIDSIGLYTLEEQTFLVI